MAANSYITLGDKIPEALQKEHGVKWGFWGGQDPTIAWFMLMAATICEMKRIPKWLAKAQNDWPLLYKDECVPWISDESDKIFTTEKKRKLGAKLALTTLMKIYSNKNGVLTICPEIKKLETTCGDSACKDCKENILAFSSDTFALNIIEVGLNYRNLLLGKLITGETSSNYPGHLPYNLNYKP